MAIRMMVGKEKAGQLNVETVTDYWGCETDRIQHRYGCQHKNDPKYNKERGPECLDCKHYEPLYMETTYVGCVLETRERNGYDDSDFYANVWDEATQSIIQVEYATTRGWTYPNSAKVDATEEVLQKVDAYLKAKKQAAQKAEEERQAKLALPGRTVKVVKGRKIPKGVIGKVFWRGVDKYAQAEFNRMHRYNSMAYLVRDSIKHRVGIEWIDSDGIHKDFTSESNLEVVQ